jgi:sterol desaturase/sphingolipid hydroxylase (fatty acid hydroxylase superfamily)
MPTIFILICYGLCLWVGALKPQIAPATIPGLSYWQARRWVINGVSGAIAIGLSHLFWGAFSIHFNLWPIEKEPFLGTWPLWLQFITLLLLYDACLYIWHRLNHEVPFLWRFHRYHHIDSELDTSTALRFHWVEMLASGIWRIPLLYVMNPTVHQWVWVAAIATIAAGFHHGRAWLPSVVERYMQWVFVTPYWHHIHHHPQREYHDGHYSVVFSIWDRLGRTTRTPQNIKIGLQGFAQKATIRWKYFFW